ncbi:myosin-2 heavy chain non muscle, partial [Biomphalaria glabrata]
PDSDKLIDKVVNTSVSLSSADSDRIRQLMTRFDVMEKAMCGYQNDNADVRETQTKMDDKLKSMSELMQKTIDRTDLKQMSLEKRVAQLSETLDKEKDNLSKRLTAHENETKDFIKKEMLGNMKRDETIQTIEKKTIELSAALIETYTSTAACVNDINAHIGSLSNHLSEHKQALNDLETRCDNSQETENLLNQQIDNHGVRLGDAERKLQSADLELKRESKKVDANSKDIHTLSGRLEKLNAGVGDVRDKQNGVIKTLQSEQKKLESLKEDWDNVKKEVQSLPRKCADQMLQRTAVGFTACPPGLSSVDLQENSRITKFTAVAHNAEGYYDPSTGYFTAPTTGLYLVSVTLCSLNPGRINVNVKHRPVNPGRADRKVKSVCRVSTTAEDNSATSVGVIRMEVGDSLYMVAVNAPDDAVLSCYSSFSCFLLC